MSEKYIFRLYALNDDKSERLLSVLKRTFSAKFKDNYEIELVDPLSNNNHGIPEKIFILPTLVKISPLPSRIVLGDLSDKSKVITALGIKV